MLSSSPNRPSALRSSSASTSWIGRICPFAFDLRSFVILVGVLIFVANLALLFQLNATQVDPEHRPNGGPVEGTEAVAHQLGKQQLNFIKSNTKNIASSLLGIKRKTDTEKSDSSSSKGAADAQAPSTTNSSPDAATGAQQQAAVEVPTVRMSNAERASIWQRPGNSHCERQFGNGFNQQFKLCAPEAPGSSPSKSASSLDCFQSPTHSGTWCDGRNVLVDLRRLNVARGGEPIESVRGRSEDAEFVQYNNGAFQLNCPRSGSGVNRDNFPHHLGDMFRSVSYTSEMPTDPSRGGSGDAFERSCDVWIEQPTLFLTRYEYANLYHSMGDFYNAYQTQWMADLQGDHEVHVVFFDGHSAGNLDEVWPKLFGPHISYVMGLPQAYAANAAPDRRNTFCFKRALFVSPAYKSALSVDMMDGGFTGGGNACGLQPTMQDFAESFMEHFDIDRKDPATVFPPSSPVSKDLFGKELFPSSLDLRTKPLATVIFRRDYLAHPRLATLTAARKIGNEDAISNAMNSLSADSHVVGVDFAKLNMEQQLLLIRYSTILAGIHGAGLSYALFLKPGASVLELSPPEYSGRPHFKFFAQWTDHNYSPMTVGGDMGGSGHHVDAGAFTSEMRRMIAPSASVDQGRPMSRPHRLIEPSAGWLKSKGAAPIANKSNKRPISISSGNGKSYTEDMIDEALPSDWTSVNPDPKYDLGADLGPSQNSGHRLCVVVPFRDSKSLTSQGGNRTANLMEMIPHMIRHLTTAGGMLFIRDFEIIVVEQTEGRVFNKGALFNVGYIWSKKHSCDYMVLHDVDQLPESASNRHQYPGQMPIHLCSASSQFGYQMAYGTMVGGALLLTMNQFERVNGYSNFYWGWGQEDDDFYYRIAARFGNVGRLSQEEGRYRALSHPRVRDLDVTPVFTKGTQHLTETRTGQFDIMTDGISNLKYNVAAVERWEKWPRGVIKIVADLQFDNMPKDLNGRAD